MIADKILTIRNQGSQRPYRHTTIGTNARCDTFQAAVLLAKLPYIDIYNTKRRRFAEIYQNLAKFPEICLPIEEPLYYHVYHQYTIRIEKRDELKAFLLKEGIPTMIYYDMPIHQQEIIKALNYDSNLIEASKCTKEVLSLPISPGLNEEEIYVVCEKISRFFAKKKRFISCV